MSDVILVRCGFCDQPTVRGDTCRHCHKPLSGQELPYIAHIPSAIGRDWRNNLKPLLISYAAASLLWIIGFGKLASVAMVLISCFFAIKILRDL